MRLLAHEAYAPITSRIGFLEAGLDQVAKELVNWQGELSPDLPPVATRLERPFPAVLVALEPLTSHVRSREMVIATHSSWTAYFDNGVRGPDPVPVMGYLARHMKTRGLAVTAIPHTAGSPGIEGGRYGAVSFEMVGPERTHFLNYIRSIAVVFNGRKWEFALGGEAQPFEDVDAYRARKATERFTFEMLDRYCRSLGVRPFDDHFYRSQAVLIERKLSVPVDALSLTLAEAQRWLEIR